jgi:hypothetical protein
VVDLEQLDSALDLWGCMWEAQERESFETALVRAMTDEHGRSTRLNAYAAGLVIGTPRLVAATERLLERGVVSPQERSQVEREIAALREMVSTAERMRGNVIAVELLLVRLVNNPNDAAVDALLDWVDIRDLVVVARTTLDARLYGLVEARLSARGRYQRGRAQNLLGFRIRQSPEIGESNAA